MFLLGIASGFISAFLQSLSYVFSASFLLHYRSSMRTLVFSHLAMGATALPLAIIFFPTSLSGEWLKLLAWMGIWILFFALGQGSFFFCQKKIEASRISSLLGLKMIVLAAICLVFLDKRITLLQWGAVFMGSAAAMTLNWSGGGKRTGALGFAVLFVTLVFYSLTDLTENHIVMMPNGGLPNSANIIRDSIGMSAMCYTVLGLVSAPFLIRFRWSFTQFKTALPFGIAYYLSQVFFFVCLGTLGAVFSIVIQSSRGLFSIFLAILLVKSGQERLDAKDMTRAMWKRRIVGSVLMMAAIALYAIGGAK